MFKSIYCLIFVTLLCCILSPLKANATPVYIAVQGIIFDLVDADGDLTNYSKGSSITAVFMIDKNLDGYCLNQNDGSIMLLSDSNNFGSYGSLTYSEKNDYFYSEFISGDSLIADENSSGYSSNHQSFETSYVDSRGLTECFNQINIDVIDEMFSGTNYAVTGMYREYPYEGSFSTDPILFDYNIGDSFLFYSSDGFDSNYYANVNISSVSSTYPTPLPTPEPGTLFLLLTGFFSFFVSKIKER